MDPDKPKSSGENKAFRAWHISIPWKLGSCKSEHVNIELVTNHVCYQTHLTQGLQNFRF